MPQGELQPDKIDWPTCPDCQTRRHTRCPICQRAGSDFPPAEFVPELEADADGLLPVLGDADWVKTLWVCPECDEAFAPEFYRLCHHCGHDFGQGYCEPTPEGEPLSDRALVTMLALGGVLVAILVYFWLVLR
jgi:ribosomal protein L37AE/L43A